VRRGTDLRVMRRLLPPISDPGLFALKGALRVAIVLPCVFAIGQEVIGDPQIALFAAFGSLAMLVFVDFGGSRRARLSAYLTLAGAGVPLIAAGTLCSDDPWLASTAMAVVGFAVLFSGIVNANFAAGANSALLAFVLPVMVPAPAADIPERLAGWGLACSASIAAVMLLWPRRPHDRLRTSVVAACRALADEVESASSGDPTRSAAGAGAALDAVKRMRRRFVEMPYRPTGTMGPTAALGLLVDDLSWIRPFATPPARRPVRFAAEEAVVGTAVVRSLRASAARLEGDSERTTPLVPAPDGVAHAFVQHVAGAVSAREDRDLEPALREAFRLRALADASEHVAADAGAAAGDRDDDLVPVAARAIGSAEELAAGYASIRSVWLRNSVRGAAGLALAVLVGQLADVQDAFWVVLGTLSVLRSNALNTGATVLRSLAGTAVGIVVGGALLLAIGTDEPVLWVVLPFAVMLAAYAPRAISFAAGQAGFTIVVMVLFNLLQPVGWELGLVRAEDLALGCAISLVVGFVFWPHGAAAVVRRSVATAYVTSADYMAATLDGLLDGDEPADLGRTAREAAAAARRLDDALRQYLAERSSARLEFDSLTTLVSGAMRLRRIADVLRSEPSVAQPDQQPDGSSGLDRCRRAIDGEIRELRAWYAALGEAIAAATEPPAPPLHEGEADDDVLRVVRDAVARGDDAAVARGLTIAWAIQHVEALRRLTPTLARAATGVAAD
jgi:uncharacterized membrane protein YccC